MGSPMAVTLDLVCPRKVKVKVTQILSGRRLVLYAYICDYFIITSIWMSQRRGCPSGLSCFSYFLNVLMFLLKMNASPRHA